MVDATAFTASGGVVVIPGSQQPATAAAAGRPAAVPLPANTAATQCSPSSPSSRVALALPAEAVWAIEHLTGALLHSIPAEDLCSLPAVIGRQEVDVLESLLVLGMPARLQPDADFVIHPLAMAMYPFGPNGDNPDMPCNQDKAELIIEVRPPQACVHVVMLFVL
jgi:hypothetical protein